MEGKCPLCLRENITLTRHHMIPREEGGKEEDVQYLCKDCHKQIHALYHNKELALRLNRLDHLRDDEQMQRYINFIKKVPSGQMVKIKKSRNRRGRRR